MTITLAVVFGCLAAYFLVAAVSAWTEPAPSSPDVTTSILHCLMSLGMFAMLLPSMALPPILIIVVFTGAALWFAYRALFGGAHQHGRYSGGNWYHTAMMAAMAVMAAAMDALGTPTGGPGAAVTEAAGTPATSMPGMQMPAVGSSGVAAPPGTAPGAGWIVPLCWVVGAAFVVAAGLLVLVAIRHRVPRGWPTAESGAAVASAVGMALAFFAMG